MGVGFYVNSRFLSNILRFEPVNDRLCWNRVRGKFRNYSIINAHVPTEDKDNEEKDKFYLELETVYSQCPRHDIKMVRVFGDFNAKVGKEESNYPYAGRNGLHEECNGNGYKLTVCRRNRHDYWGTIFTHKNIHTVTWKSPDGDTMNQIDHILIPKKHSSDLKDVRCKRGVNVDSDHYLVMAEIQAKISMDKTHKGQRVWKYNVQCLEKEEIQQAFRSKIMELDEGTSANEESQNGIEKQWFICEKIMKEAAESVIGMQGPPQRNDWFDDECAAATSLKNKAYKNMLDKKNTKGGDMKKRKYIGGRRGSMEVIDGGDGGSW